MVYEEEIHGKNTRVIVRLHEERMRAIERRLEGHEKRFEDRIRCVENKVNKIPWILLVVLINMILSGGVVIFNLIRMLSW